MKSFLDEVAEDAILQFNNGAEREYCITFELHIETDYSSKVKVKKMP